MYTNIKDIEALNVDNIYLDYDCTMVDSIKAVLNQLNERYNTAYITSDCTTWNFNNLFPDLTECELLEIFDSERFFEDVELYEGMWEFINRNHDKITIVTCGLAMNLYRKEQWIRKFFPNIKFIGIDSVVMDKSSVKMGKNSMHIDDNQDNLRSTDAEYKVMFVNVKDANWNDKWTAEKTDIRGTKYGYGIRRDGYWEQRFKINSWK